jgi:hypothetical protein
MLYFAVLLLAILTNGFMQWDMKNTSSPEDVDNSHNKIKWDLVLTAELADRKIVFRLVESKANVNFVYGG